MIYMNFSVFNSLRILFTLLIDIHVLYCKIRNICSWLNSVYFIINIYRYQPIKDIWWNLYKMIWYLLTFVFLNEKIKSLQNNVRSQFNKILFLCKFLLHCLLFSRNRFQLNWAACSCYQASGNFPGYHSGHHYSGLHSGNCCVHDNHRKSPGDSHQCRWHYLWHTENNSGADPGSTNWWCY